MDLRTRALTVTLALMLVMGAACTSDDGVETDDARRRVLAAADATLGAGTARIEQEIVMELPERIPAGDPAPTLPEGSLEVVTTGAVDMQNGRARLHMTTSGAGLAGADALAGDTEVILIDDTLYLSSPFYQQLAPRHEPWLRIAYEELAARGVSQVGQQDPLTFVRSLRGIAGEVEEDGVGEVRGAPARRYRATIDVAALRDELPPDQREAIDASFRQFGLERVPVDLWLDDQGRVVRMVSDAELGGAAAGGRLRVRLELFDFGVAFELRRPRSNEVAEFSEVFGSVGN